MADCAVTVKNVNTLSVVLENNSEIVSLQLVVENPATLCNFLASHCRISKIKIKDALGKGAAQLQRAQSKRRRVRKAKFQLLPDDIVYFHYSAKILQLQPPQPHLLHENKHYSVWFKPTGMLSQGSPFGDHCALLRYIDLHYARKYKVKLIHRLDRDAQGLMIFAHSRYAAQKLSKLFSTSRIVKKYTATVHGIMGARGDIARLTEPIDAKEASTCVEIKYVDIEKNISFLDITLNTGRKHQIRRHLSSYGFAIAGDTLYGKEKASGNLQLTAYLLSFSCPFTHTEVMYQLEKNHRT